MGFTKIVEADLTNIGVIGLPDTPGLSTASMQAKLEETSRGVIIPKHNALIDELQDTSSAGNLGAVPLAGRTSNPTIQSVMEKLSADLAVVEGSSVSDTFKNIESGGATFTASGDDTFKINAGSNVTITPLASPDKGIQISATGGGQSTGDMRMNDYDSQGNVKTAGGIEAYVTSAISGKADTADLPTKTSDLTNDSNFVADASYVHTDNNYDATAKGIVDGASAAIAAKSTVAWNQQITTGQRIAIVTIDGTPVDVFAPTGGSPGTGSVDSVNGYTGTVVLTAADVGALPSSTAIPTKTSDLTNDSGFITSTSVPTKTSDLTNDSGFQTASDVSSAIGALDATITGAAANKTLATLTETDGVISATYQDISITKSQVSDFPSIPSAANDGTLTIQQNGTTKGTFTADQVTNSSVDIVTDEWTAPYTTLDGTTAVFSGLNDAYGYDLYCEDKLIGISAIAKTGSGTSTTLTYTVTGASIGDVFKLRIIK